MRSIYRAALAAAAFLLLTGMAPVELRQKIQDAARRASLDPKLVTAIIRVESNFEAKAVSPKGAMGLMQVMPKTAEASDIHAPYHTVSNLMGACEYLRSLINRYRGNLKLALAAYNAGPGNVARHGGIPPFTETRDYVRRVLAFYEELKKNRK
jgi:soluble lytic murein transglycosylase-like protein